MIHIFQGNETVSSIASYYGVSASRIRYDNSIPIGAEPVEGQALLVLIPELIHRVESGETVSSIANLYSIGEKQLVRNNPYLISSPLNVGDYVVISYRDKSYYPAHITGYAYPNISRNNLREALLYINDLAIFSYGFTPDGALIQPNDTRLLNEAISFGVNPILVLTPSTDLRAFSNELINNIVNDEAAQDRLLGEITSVMYEKGYTGIDMDFEYIRGENRDAYTAFIQKTANIMRSNGFTTNVALAPKTSADQRGLLYEGIDYRALGEAADSVLLMTYEWGYTYGPPMAVAPIPQVTRVLEYALSEIPANKIDLGIPNYGYDWPLPFVQGQTRARTIGNMQAVEIARDNGASIQFSNTSQAPFFTYPDHEVWFEDVRSIDRKFDLIEENSLRGGGYWNLLRAFRPNWLLLNERFL